MPYNLNNTSVDDDIFLSECIVLLVVDDDPAVLQVTRLVLSKYQYQNRTLEILEAGSAAEARDILDSREDIAVVLLDVVMESDDAGLSLVEYIRHTLGNFRIRILIRTGQPGYAPERRVVQDYDINDYLMKADATQARLVVSLTTAIRGYFDILRAENLARQVQRSEAARESANLASFQKTQFLAHMSHEIRTPLNGVVGLVSLLAETDLSAEQQDLITDLRFSADALLGLVNDVLDVSKIEAGKLELVSAEFNLTELFNKIVAIFTVSLKRKGIHFSQEFRNFPLSFCVGDAQRIQQILINYLSNAQKFTPEGGHIVFRADCRVGDDNKLQLYAEVEDDGLGIHEDRLAGIFNPYEQESADIARRYGGTGLGLSLSRSLADLMNGRVGVDSQPGKGSRFWLRIPLQQADIAAEKKLISTDISLADWNILIAEDDLTSQKILARMLQNLGAVVHCFADGQALLDSGLAADADVILLDCNMPVLSGPECSVQLRNQGLKQPILALTGAVTDSERDHCLAAGMNDVLPKPLDRQRLVSWLKNNAAKR